MDADDEYITEKCFLPTLPGEYTKLSSALALFKVSRILAKVLTENYPASATYDLSLRKIMALSDELDDWLKTLPSHLRLQFVQDKPSTNVVSSRSPLLVSESRLPKLSTMLTNVSLWRIIIRDLSSTDQLFARPRQSATWLDLPA